jgi:hypothetical protein
MSSAKDLLQEAESLIEKAIGIAPAAIPPAPPPVTKPVTAPVVVQPSLSETNLEAARVAKAAEAKK